MIRILGLSARLALGLVFGWMASCSVWLAYAPDGCLERTSVTAAPAPVKFPPVDVWWADVSRLVEVNTPHGGRSYLVGPDVTVEVTETAFIATNADFRFVNEWGADERPEFQGEDDVDSDAEEAE